ncbi:recombinase rad51, putative [Leishmania panamensis]|uniref:DNA repair protein RAD51 homolog 3 n=1 Tax=Leishmania panamensis TaxID=5679 RepID=A0A088S019_LEIPA|nr:recombinase rad51, putative [Leishmania panamensis]AIO01551.1 recombinase rad51, putative [Leishmania panamensis]
MALIECSESLSSATKAKLRDAGILYVSDVVALLSSKCYRAGDDSEDQVLSVLRHPSALLRHQVSRSDSCPPRRLKPDTPGESGGAFDDQSEPAHVSALRETAMRSTLRKVAGASRFLNLTEDEVNEIVEMAIHATVMADEASKKHSVTASSAQGRHSSYGALSSSPPRPPESPSRFTNSAHNTRENAHATDSHTGAIPGCRTLRELYAEVEARQARGLPTHVTTFSRQLDGILGGGIPVDGVTEISGPPGVGKTQLLMQLAVSCAMPVEFGGMGGACLFVDTEGSFVVERLEQMATAAVSLVRTILFSRSSLPRSETAAAPPAATRQPPGSHRKRCRSPPLEPHTVPYSHGSCPNMGGIPGIQEEFTVESVLQRVHYVRVTDLAGLLALLYSLPSWLEEERSDEAKAVDTGSTAATSTCSSRQDKSADSGVRATVRMVLIDSIALPFRSSDDFHRGNFGRSTSGGGDSAMDLLSCTGRGAAPNSLLLQSPYGLLSKHGLWQRSRLLFQCSTLLEHVAATFQLAIVVTNHMTTKTLRDVALNHTTNGSATEGSACSAAAAEGNAGQLRQSVLVPALGDMWSHGLSTRLLLSFHHYDIPVCSFVDLPTSPTTATVCTEDVVYSLTARQQASLRSVAQHRVVRVLKCSGQPRREACFLITSKGIRDACKDMVSQRFANSVGSSESHQ